MTKAIAAIAGLLILGGCAATMEQTLAPSPEPQRPPAGNCDASAVQDFLGQIANQQNGASILAASEARVLRWGPPDSAWTMDYRDDRVNVRYNANMAITAVTCG